MFPPQGCRRQWHVLVLQQIVWGPRHTNICSRTSHNMPFLYNAASTHVHSTGVGHHVRYSMCIALKRQQLPACEVCQELLSFDAQSPANLLMICFWAYTGFTINSRRLLHCRVLTCSIGTASCRCKADVLQRLRFELAVQASFKDLGLRV